MSQKTNNPEMKEKNKTDGVIELNNISKSYGSIQAVDSIDLRVNDGELLVLLGPSGCGKSTTLRMIAGLEVPTEGTIRIGDKDVTQKVPKDRDISMVFQEYALYPHKTVRGNLKFPLKKTDYTSQKIEEKIISVAQLLEIESLLDKTPAQLSGGQQQRVALGRTIVREPSAFLMDEPLSNLDAKLRVQTRAEIRQLQQDLGTTTVYVTHDQEEAMSIADRIAVMDDGEIQHVGTPQDIYTKPKNKFVSNFVGEPSINFIKNGEKDTIVDTSGIDGKFPSQVKFIGIRPEDISLTNSYQANTDNCVLPVTFENMLVEPLGNEYEVTLSGSDDRLVILTKNRPEEEIVNNNTCIEFSTNDTYLFDSDENRVTEGE